ncbi:MAG: redoxin domain-containing protein [Planctomycetes bacterium]|nr:redoxin domain-containing protein [Planctomycetota bacterium]
MNRLSAFGIYVLAVLFLVSPLSAGEQKIVTLKLGASAPNFNLPGVDGKNHKLSDYSKSDVLVVIFTCNHCPTAQAYEQRLIKLAEDYKKKSVAIVAISPNDPRSVSLAELGYSDISDSLEEMKLRAKHLNFNFPYLYDGDKQQVSRAYGPATTPHVFIFDKQRKLRYVGRIDDSERIGTAKKHDTRNAIDALLSGKEVPVKKTKTFGCSIKWAGKYDYIKYMKEQWAKEPVTLKPINPKALKELLSKKTDKVRLINFWATWCGPCTVEFPELINIHRMYKNRKFEMITVSLDYSSKHADALEFLKKLQASTTNYISDSEDPYKLIDVVDNWQGGMPHTIILDTDGKVIYQGSGMFKPLNIKRLLVEKLGRHYE